MIKLSASAVGLALVLTPAFGAEHSQPEAQKAVTAFVEHYVNLFNSKNAKGIADLFTEDGIEVPPNQIVTGRDNIEKWFQSIFTSGAKDVAYKNKIDVQPAGDYVFAVGQYTVKLPAASGGTGEHEVMGNFVNVYQWDGDSLKYRVHSYNFIPPAQQ